MSSEIIVGERKVKVYENKTRKLTNIYDKITGSLKSEIVENKKYKIYLETNHLLQPEHILYLDKSQGISYRFSRGADNRLFMHKTILPKCPHTIKEILKIIESTRHMMHMQECGRVV